MIPPIDKNTFIQYQFGIGKTKIYRWLFLLQLIEKFVKLQFEKLATVDFCFPLGKQKPTAGMPTVDFGFPLTDVTHLAK